MNTTQNYGLAVLAIMMLMLASGEIHRAFAVTPLSHAPVQTRGLPGQYGQGVVLANSAIPGARSPQMKYGLVQTGVFGVARADQNGQFGAPTAMPVFQLIQLQAPQRMAALQNGVQPQAVPQGRASAPKLNPAQSNAKTTLPPGITISEAPASSTIATRCEINSVQVLTPSAQACTAAGGKAIVQAR